MIFGLAMAALLASWGLTYVALRYALRRGLLDHPGHRSSHQRATPRGGGIGIVIGFLAGVAILWLVGRLEAPLALSLLGGGAMVAFVGYRDDHRSLSPVVRLAAHFAAALWVVAILALWRPVLPWNSWLPGAWNPVLIVPAVIWMINLYNFMDGIDGLAAGEVITASLTMMAIAGAAGSMSPLLMFLAASAVGFLFWNWPPARIFLGDVGSGFLGFVLAVIALWSVTRGQATLWQWGIVLAVFLVDASWTLSRRILGGQPFWRAHRSHAYQIASRRWGSHLRITLAALAINLGWLAPLAWAAGAFPSFGPIMLLLAWLPLGATAYWLGAGNPDS